MPRRRRPGCDAAKATAWGDAGKATAGMRCREGDEFTAPRVAERDGTLNGRGASNARDGMGRWAGRVECTRRPGATPGKRRLGTGECTRHRGARRLARRALPAAARDRTSPSPPARARAACCTRRDAGAGMVTVLFILITMIVLFAIALPLLIVFGVLSAVVSLVRRHPSAAATKTCPRCGLVVWSTVAQCPRCGYAGAAVQRPPVPGRRRRVRRRCGLVAWSTVAQCPRCGCAGGAVQRPPASGRQPRVRRRGGAATTGLWAPATRTPASARALRRLKRRQSPPGRATSCTPHAGPALLG